MKSSLLLALLLPVCSYGLDFPTEEFTRVPLQHGLGAAICQTWLERDGEPRMLVALRDSSVAGASRLAIVGLNEVIWESEPIPGGSTVGKRIEVADQDVRLYTSWIVDTTGWIREFRGDGFADSRDYRIGSLRINNESGINLNYDDRSISHVINDPGSRAEAPSLYFSRGVISQSYDEHSGFTSDSYSELVKLTLESGELTKVGGTHVVTDYEWVNIPGFDQPKLLAGSWYSIGFTHPDGYWNKTELVTPLISDSAQYSKVLSYSVLMGPLNGWCCFFPYRLQNESGDRCLVFAPRFDPNQGQYGRQFPTAFELAGEGWPIANSIALDNIVQFGSGPTRFRHSGMDMPLRG